jgi:hypothetical protein
VDVVVADFVPTAHARIIPPYPTRGNAGVAAVMDVVMDNPRPLGILKENADAGAAALRER